MEGETRQQTAARMLRLQGALLDRWLQQNLGERYVYLIIAAPQEGLAGMHCIHNLRDDVIAENTVHAFEAQLAASAPPRLAPPERVEQRAATKDGAP